jgi:glycosyltransferase involved in cell wall biosynthesis
MDKKQVLLISQVFYPDEVAVANLFTKLCSALVSNNINIEVWCAQPSYTTQKRQPKLRIYNGIKIRYLNTTNFQKNKVTGRLLNYLTFGIYAACKLLITRRNYLVISHTAPPFLAIVISFICSIKKLRNLYVILDVFPDGLIRLNKVSPGNVLIRLWQKLHLSLIKNCSRVVVIGRDMKDWLSGVCPPSVSKTEYIPVWQDDELIKPLSFEQNPFVIKHDLLNSFVVQYSGNMGLWNDMRDFGNVVNRNPENVKFVFIGGGMRLRELLDSFETPYPENVLLMPFVSNDEYAISVSACHASMVSLRSGAEGMAVPSKIIGIMAAGIPVIAVAPDKSEIAYIVREEKCGIVVNPGDRDELLNTIHSLRSNEQLRKTLGDNGRNAFERKYTTKIIAGRYLNLINELVN